MLELTEVINQMDITDIYTTFHPNKKEYTFFSESDGLSPKLTTFLDTNLKSQWIQENGKSSLHPIRPSRIKAGYQQQQNQHKALHAHGNVESVTPK